MLTPEQQTERDPAAIQQELLRLAEMAAQTSEELTEATRVYHEALGKKKVLEAKRDWIKQQISALQSVLKSLSMV